MTKSTSKLHLEILDKDRVNTLKNLSPFYNDFVLSGGTALGLQIGHRKSFDFDFFSETKISKKLIFKLKDIFEIDSISLDNENELTFQTKKIIKISFVHYPFSIFKKFSVEENGLRMFPVLQIAAQKAYTIGRRAAYRDIFDIYAIIKETRLSLFEIIEEAENNFGDVFNSKLFLEQLVYFEDIIDFEIEPPSENIVLANPDEIKKFLSDQIKQYLM